MAQYELAVLYHPDLEIDLDKAEAKVKKILSDADSNAKIVAADAWGKRKLAYPIKKQEHAVYVFYTVELAPESIRKVESALNITDEVIRFLIVRPDLKAIAKAEAMKAEKAKRAAEREESASEEEKDSDDSDDEEE